MKIDNRQGVLNVAVLFGGMSPEHEVSIISSMQAIAAFDRKQYNPVPVYIAKDGTWYAGDALSDLDAYKNLTDVTERARAVVASRGSFGKMKLIPASQSIGNLFTKDTPEIDVVFLGLHGGTGENGSIQGLCEALNVPFTGSGVFGSALGMDKVATKQVCRAEGVPVVDYVDLRESRWAGNEEGWLDRCVNELGMPVVVKPARLGSSIGISKASNREELDSAIEEAFRYDDKIVVERAITNLKEINCSVMGTPNEAEASVLEQPVSSDELLTFKDKYMRGSGGKKGASKPGGGMASLDRLIPAPLDEIVAEEARSLSIRIFQLFECSGVARVDLMIDEDSGQIYFNEINTIPGSFSFYLWDPAGVPFDALVDRMVTIALENHFNANRRVRTYDVNLLSSADLKGIKTVK